MIKFQKLTAYHAKTEEEAIWLLAEDNKQGFKWRSGQSFLIRTSFDVYNSKTVYLIVEGMYCNLDYAKNNNYKIISVESLMTNKVIEIW